jgi:hypothetical protein
MLQDFTISGVKLALNEGQMRKFIQGSFKAIKAN